MGADRLGLPRCGSIAGLGVGGLAIALAAQPTIENLIGGLSLFADKPIRVGDVCQYGSDLGKVESIGIRSTRIRGVDRTLTTIPNAALSRTPVVNLSQRDRMLIKCVFGVRYETSPEQLRYLLARTRETLLSHPRISPEGMRARFVGFGASSLDIEVFAYATTRDWPEFLGIREDVFLRVMDVFAVMHSANRERHALRMVARLRKGAAENLVFHTGAANRFMAPRKATRSCRCPPRPRTGPRSRRRDSAGHFGRFP